MVREKYDEELMYEELLKHIEEATKAMVAGVLTEHEETLNTFYHRNTVNLKNILARPYLRISYEAAVELLKVNGFEQLTFGDDLEALHEAKIVELVNISNNYGTQLAEFSPVLIMRYPKEIKFFNMKVSDKDPRVVLSADCVFPYSGEAVGSAVREHDGIKLLVRLLTSSMFRILQDNGGRYEDFKWYVEDMIIAQKTQPHAGYGIGSERVLQFILGSSDIRQCSIMSLMATQTRDWLPLAEKQKSEARTEVVSEVPIEVQN
jgi:asparaginyl-tRNA synthetase